MEKLLQFIKSQKVMTIAVSDERGPWAANVYYTLADNENIYFVSPKDSRHSKMILNKDQVAFSIAWFDKNNIANRKGVQGLGVCQIVKNPKEIINAIRALNTSFPDFKDTITAEWIASNMWGTRVWVLKPNYAKYYDDAIYGEEESEEFNF